MNIGVDFDKFIKQAVTVDENYTKMPNIVIDSIMQNVSPNAYKCLNVIVRCTLGYQRESYQIAQTLFLEITGIKRKETVIDAIRELEQLKIISVDRSTHINTFFLTFDQYEKTVLVRKISANSVSTEKPYQVSTNNPYSVSTEKPYPIKERKKKENIYKFSFVESLKNLGAEDQLIQDWLVVRKTKKASNSETAFKGFDRELKKSNLDVNTVLRICIERSWQGFTASWLNNIDLSSYQNQVEVQQPTQTIPTDFKGVRKSFKGMDQ